MKGVILIISMIIGILVTVSMLHAGDTKWPDPIPIPSTVIPGPEDPCQSEVLVPGPEDYAVKKKSDDSDKTRYALKRASSH